MLPLAAGRRVAGVDDPLRYPATTLRSPAGKLPKRPASRCEAGTSAPPNRRRQVLRAEKNLKTNRWSVANADASELH